MDGVWTSYSTKWVWVGLQICWSCPVFGPAGSTLPESVFKLKALSCCSGQKPFNKDFIVKHYQEHVVENLKSAFLSPFFFSSFTQQNLILYIILMSNFNCCEKWKHNVSQLPWWTVVLLHSHLWAFIMFPLQVESCATASGDWFCIMGPVWSSAFYPTFLNWPKSSTQYRAPITPTWLAT